MFLFFEVQTFLVRGRLALLFALRFGRGQVRRGARVAQCGEGFFQFGIERADKPVIQQKKSMFALIDHFLGPLSFFIPRCAKPRAQSQSG